LSERLELVFGPPGTGKTTYCLRQVAEELVRGVSPDEVAFLAFSRAAAREARDRAREQMPELAGKELPFFRTLHSLAKVRAGVTTTRLIRHHHWQELGKELGLTFAGVYDELTERAPSGDTRALGDRCLRLYGLSRARLETVAESWRKEGGLDMEPSTALRFERQLELFKRHEDLVDFGDLLELDRRPLPVKLLVIDEAQDLTPQQWAYVRRIAAGVPRVILAGDDDQAIYEWSGADPIGMLRFRGRVTVLPVSHRLPSRIASIAVRLAEQITVRQPKKWLPRDAEGATTVIADETHLNLREGNWLLLARHRFHLDRFVAEARRQGVAYRTDSDGWSTSSEAVKAAQAQERLRRGETVSRSEAALVARLAGMKIKTQNAQGPFSRADFNGPAEWPTWYEHLTHMSPEEREYVRDLRRQGESMKSEGRIRITTIHGAKGLEADRVALISDVSRAASVISDAEFRVQYVGASRAREELLITAPRTSRYHDYTLL